mmetsp:Transcript_99150/g.318138  ORF Transcript_99150/g.318138 Transcript_99150/m.318138 type:complete len:108 (+) Transcript_99150:1200-1523(+)
MPPQPSQDGHCGNFNGDGSDDTHDLIVGRIGDSVEKPDLIFSSFTPRLPGQKLTLADCPADALAQARADCQTILDRDGASDENGLYKACVFDVCFAGERYSTEDTNW